MEIYKNGKPWLASASISRHAQTWDNLYSHQVSYYALDSDVKYGFEELKQHETIWAILKILHPGSCLRNAWTKKWESGVTIQKIYINIYIYIYIFKIHTYIYVYVIINLKYSNIYIYIYIYIYTYIYI